MHISIFLGAACKVLVVQPTHSGFCFLQPPLWITDPLEARRPETAILIEKVNNPCSNTAPHQDSAVPPLLQSDTQRYFCLIIPWERQLLLFSLVFSRQQFYNRCSFTKTILTLNTLLYTPYYGPAFQTEGNVHHFNHHCKPLKLLAMQKPSKNSSPSYRFYSLEKKPDRNHSPLRADKLAVNVIFFKTV